MAGLKYVKISATDPVVSYLTEKISKHLDLSHPVLWLVAGGSAMDIAVRVANRLKDNRGLSRLTITLTDERYGPPGHPDSNWEQLAERKFELPGAKLMPVLTGQNPAQTAADYAQLLNGQLSRAGYSIALAGMGPDGHIFGIKPKSPSVGAAEDVSAYQWDDYHRITPTINIIKKIDEVVVYAAGSEKHPQLELLDKDIGPRQQPAQLLKQLKDVTIFNDYRGEGI